MLMGTRNPHYQDMYALRHYDQQTVDLYIRAVPQVPYNLYTHLHLNISDPCVFWTASRYRFVGRSIREDWDVPPSQQ